MIEMVVLYRSTDALIDTNLKFRWNFSPSASSISANVSTIKFVRNIAYECKRASSINAKSKQ